MSEQSHQQTPLEHSQEHKKHWYDKSYKMLLVLPILLFVGCLVYLSIFYNQNGDFFLKDATLSGGTTITLLGDIDEGELENSLKQEFPDIYVRKITDITTGESLAVLVDSSAGPEELRTGVEDILGYALTEENSSTEFTGPSLSGGFYKQLLIAVLISFVLMSIVVFFLFRSFIPCIAVIIAVFMDIVFALTVADIIGLRISAAGIAAFLMLIGYSVDTDILLTTRVLKNREGTVNARIYRAFKTGIFMTIVALVALLPAFFIVTGIPDSFKQIFLIAAFGLVGDAINTWLTNASILKWYAEARDKK